MKTFVKMDNETKQQGFVDYQDKKTSDTNIQSLFEQWEQKAIEEEENEQNKIDELMDN